MQNLVQDLLCTDILKITPDVSLEFAISLALYRNLDNLYVVDDKQHLVGIVPEYSMIKALILEENRHVCVEQIMSRHVKTCSASAAIEKIVPLFREACHECIAVVEKGKLIGQLRRSHILLWLASQAEQKLPQETQAPLSQPNFLKSRRSQIQESMK